MKFFLLEYHRPSGELRTLVEYDDGHEAMSHRFDVENGPDIEVVVLVAQSLDVIRQTHSRYFYNERWEHD